MKRLALIAAGGLSMQNCRDPGGTKQLTRGSRRSTSDLDPTVHHSVTTPPPLTTSCHGRLHLGVYCSDPGLVAAVADGGGSLGRTLGQRVIGVSGHRSSMVLPREGVR